MHSKKNVVYLIHSVIYLLQTTEVHRHTHKTYNIYRKKTHKERQTERNKTHLIGLNHYHSNQLLFHHTSSVVYSLLSLDIVTQTRRNTDSDC